jgi:hypothetical protein
MSPDDVRQKLEEQVVELIQSKLADGSLTEERAQAMSKYTLEILRPGMSFDELYRAVPKLDDQYQELAPVVLPIVREYEERVVAEAQKGVSELIRQGQFDAAVKLSEKVVSQDVKLEWQGAAKAENPSS